MAISWTPKSRLFLIKCHCFREMDTAGKAPLRPQQNFWTFPATGQSEKSLCKLQFKA